MLRILTITIIITTCSAIDSYAKNRFFDTKVNFFQKETNSAYEKTKCLDCKSDIQKNYKRTSEDNPARINKTPELSGQEDIYNKKLTKIALFLDTNCPYSNTAIEALKQSAQDNPDIRHEIFVTNAYNSFLPFIKERMDIFDANITVSYDINAKQRVKHKISKCPTYIITKGNTAYKAEGIPVLNDLIGELK